MMSVDINICQVYLKIGLNLKEKALWGDCFEYYSGYQNRRKL